MIKTWQSGQTRVKAIYCGQPVTGVVIEGRGFPRGNKTQLTVVLDSAITVYGQVRDRVILTDDDCVEAA